MRYSDRPIYRPGEDAIGRSQFALELAQSIDNLSAVRDGFVIAILGPWGAGKSSVIELTIRSLRHLEMQRASEHALLGEHAPAPQTLEHLEEMAQKFEKVEHRVSSLGLVSNVTQWDRYYTENEFRRWIEDDGDASDAYRYWRLKLKVDTQPRTIITRFSPWLIAGRVEMATALLSELARSIGSTSDSELRRSFAALIERVAELAPLAGAGLDILTGGPFGRLLAGSSQVGRQLANKLSTGPTLDDLRNQLRNALRALDESKILVVVDDLDRLTPPEALEMVSLVKSLGDLPNVVYLLSYDQNRLERLLRKASKLSGRKFLEKIVQYSVHLPPIDTEDLTTLLEAGLREMFELADESEKRRLGHTWHLVFRHYIRTPRDVRRYLNSVSVSFAALKDHADPVDLLLTEALRIFEPDIYWWLRRNAELITE